MDEGIKVLVDLERYTELIIAEEHYNNIINMAMDGATLSSWKKDELDIDTTKIESYIKMVESGRLGYIKTKLQMKKRQAELVEENCMEVKA